MREKITEYIKENSIEFAIISAITIFALFLRILLLQNYGDLWLDELYSWYFASQKNVFVTVFELLKQDLHMPLYFIILHAWIKVFGQSDTSMHLCTLILTIPLIPLSFYLAKNLFGKIAGYFAILAFTINSFCMYYSLEVRFYGLVFVLSLLVAFFFVKMMENFENKYILGFIIANTLLLYTFSITPILIFCYGIVGGVYILFAKKEYLKSFCNILGVIFLIALPTVIFTLYNFILMKTQTICSFSKDIYIFNLGVILDILENFFTNFSYHLFTGQENVYISLLNKLQYYDYVIFVFVPILIGLAGFARCIFSNDKKLYLFLFPSLLFLIITLIIGALGINPFITRYTAIIYPIIICSVVFGLLLMKPKVVSVFFFAIFFVLNSLFYFFVKPNIYNIKRSSLGDMPEIMKNRIKLSDEDIVLIPYSGSRVIRYIPNGKYINFNMDDALLLKDNKSKEFYFGSDQKVTRQNVKNILYLSVIANRPFTAYERNLYENYIAKMEQGQRLIIVSYRNKFTLPLNLNWHILKNPEEYKNENLFILIMSKVLRDSIQVADKYLEQKDFYGDSNGEYSIYVYEKKIRKNFL